MIARSLQTYDRAALSIKGRARMGRAGVPAPSFLGFLLGFQAVGEIGRTGKAGVDYPEVPVWFIAAAPMQCVKGAN